MGLPLHRDDGSGLEMPSRSLPAFHQAIFQGRSAPKRIDFSLFEPINEPNGAETSLKINFSIKIDHKRGYAQVQPEYSNVILEVRPPARLSLKTESL